MEIKTDLSRAELRYQCYSMREQGKCDKAHEKLLKKVEDLPGFEGWENFANTWDFKLKFEDGEKVLSQPLTLIWQAIFRPMVQTEMQRSGLMSLAPLGSTPTSVSTYC